MKRSKAYRQASEQIDRTRLYSPAEAVTIAKANQVTKFDPTVEVALRLGVDPRKQDQMVRGTVNLPNGTGKTARVLVFATGDRAEEARAAGADYVGSDDLIERIQGGFLDFDAVVATPDLIGKVGRRDHRVEVEEAALDALDQVVGAHVVRPGRAGLLGPVAGREDQHTGRLAGAVRQVDRAADHLVLLTRVHAEPQRHLYGRIELGDLVRLGDGDRLGGTVQPLAVDVLTGRAVGLAALHCSSPDGLEFVVVGAAPGPATVSKFGYIQPRTAACCSRPG